MCLRSGVGEASGFHLGLGDGYPRLSRGPCWGCRLCTPGRERHRFVRETKKPVEFRVILRPGTAILKLYGRCPGSAAYRRRKLVVTRSPQPDGGEINVLRTKARLRPTTADPNR